MKNIFLTIPPKRLLTIIFLLCLNSSFAQTVYYANSATGNDANAGTIGAPFKTFHKAYTTATSGDIINLTGTFTWTASDEIGDVSTTGYSISKNITIEGNNASTTIIQAANADNISDRRVFTFIFGYTVNINNCTIRYGKSSDGGGIQVDGSSTINNCDVSYNRASGSGGGVNCRGNVLITNSLVSNNFAFYMGGGLNRDYYSGNGGTPGSSNTLIITNSTIAYNQVLSTIAYIEGGGVFFRRGIGTITNSIIAYNKVTNADSSTNGLGTGDPSAVVNLKNNIIANNFRYNCWSGDIGHRESSNSGTYVDNGYNIFGVKGYYSQGLTVSSTSWLDHISNCSTPDGVFILQNGQNCRSGQLYLATVLAENSTLNNIKNFEILDQTSIAINNGSNTSNLSTSIPNLDMRGFSRVGNVDIGSIEYQSVVASFEAPVAGNISSSQLVCYNSIASDITLSGYTGSIQWQTSLNNSTWTNISGATNSILTSTQIGTLTQTKYFRANVSNGGCTVTSNPTVSVTVNSLPSRPVTVTTINYCQGDTATALTATATTGHTLQWYTVSTGGTASLTAPTPITSSVGTTTYYVSQLNNSTNCESERGAITVTVYSLPLAPTAPTTINYCQGVTATAFTATASTGHSLQWYTVSTGGTASSTAPTPLTTTLGATIYYVSQKNNTTNCEGPRTAITVNVNAIPTISGVQNITVGGNTLQLTGSGTPNAATPWVSSNTAIATISSTGVVTAISGGSTTITYTTSEGCSVSGIINILNCEAPFGNAMSFDGTNDYVTVGDSFENLADVTTEAWVYWRGSTNAFSEIFTKDLVSAFAITSTNKLHANFGNGSGWDIGLNSTAFIPLNTWTHLAVTRQNGLVRMYINGQQDSATATMSATGQNSSHRALGAKLLGTSLYPNSTINGSIDEVRFWSTARTQAQIQASMNTELVGNESGLLAYYTFNHGIAEGNNASVNTIVNIVNSASNGTITNSEKNGTISNLVVGVTADFTISGAAIVCANRTSQFTHPITGGTWSVSNGAAATVSTSGLLTAIGSENISVSYTYTINDCSFTATKAVEIVSPAITAQPSTAAQNLCLNENATALTITATNLATTYQWYRNATASNTGGTLISGATSSSYTPPTNVAGTTYYYCIVSGTCSPAITSDVSGAVTVSPISVAGTISGATSVCSGVTTTLTLSGSVGAIQWQQLIGPTWTDIAGATNTTFTSPALTQNTSYRAVITSGFCSSVNTANYNVVVNVLPIISGASSVGVGESVALTATTTAASSNAWVSSNSVIATITNAGVVNGLTIGTTTITYTNSNSCSATQSIAVTAGTTQTPVLTSPATNSTGATILNISYTLPETPLAGSVRLTFTPTAGGTPIVWTMTNTTSVTFSHSVGTDPLVTNPNNVLSGTLLSFTTYDLTLSYQDAYGNPVAQVTNTNIQTLAPPSISFSSASYQGTINTSLITITVLNGGGTSTYSISPTLPNGVSINTTTGVVSGIPTVAMATQLYTVTAANAAGTSTATFNLFIDSDLDGDGIGDTTDPDIDGDGVPNIEEIQEGTSPTDPTDYKDTDGDGVPDYVEVQQGTNPNVPGDARDTDGDGVPDYIEIQQGTNPNTPGDSLIDTDGDGVPDYVEVQQGSDPNNPNDSIDTDGDGIPDYVENLQGTNPNIPGDAIDTDGDGVPDYIEVQQGTNPNVPGDARDTDGDGVPDYIEIFQGTNPNTPGDSLIDTDGDGVPDYVEIQQGSDPNNPNDSIDTDGDGIPDYVENLQGTNPNIPGDAIDTDGDGVPDYVEVQQGTNPNLPGDGRDTDGDGVPDYVETRQGTNPTTPGDTKDTDGDGVPDYVEIRQGTNPTIPGDAKDTDGDGVPDYVEVQQGTNPNDSNDARDTDRDGIPDYVENLQGTNPNIPGDAIDTDGDGVPDYIEVQQGTNPNVPGDARDTDGDGVPDYIEIQQGTNPNTPGDALDTDGDGVPDYIELREGTDPNDPSDLKDDDGDGISNFEEGYNYQNPNDSRDTDGDGIPDYRDLDSDGDTIPDRYDAFPLDKTEWKDTDGDGIGDNADTDDDSDGILDVCDVDVNGDGIPDNGVDMDGDGIIDSCDPDRDGDGVNNTSDNCPDTPNRDQADRDRDGKGDVCDTIELNVAAAITPNGDGINDTWVIYNIENHPGSIVRVFNTNGKQVFYSANYKNDWNGNYQGSSEMLPVGSYLFQIDLDGDGTIDSQGWMYISK